MAGSGAEIVGAEAIDEHDGATIDAPETEPRGLALDRREAIPEHVGKARSAVGGPG